MLKINSKINGKINRLPSIHMIITKSLQIIHTAGVNEIS
jgi:hypothetical protein